MLSVIVIEHSETAVMNRRKLDRKIENLFLKRRRKIANGPFFAEFMFV